MDFSKTEQNNGVSAPPIQKPYPMNAKLIDLLVEEEWENIYNTPFARAVKNRKSRRDYSGDPLSLEELSFYYGQHKGFV